MFKLATLLSLIMFTSAKTIFLDNDLDDVLPIKRHNRNEIWVLSFDEDFDVNPLRQPNKQELKIFKNSIAPVIKRNQKIMDDNDNVDFNESERPIKARLTLEKRNVTVQEIKLELKSIINKFLYSIAVVDPRQSISSKKDKQSSLKIYFIGNSSSLVLQSGRFRNVYFNDAEHGLLPKWFFEEHDSIEHDSNGNFIPIPQDVKPEFYEDLLNLAKTLYGYAIN